LGRKLPNDTGSRNVPVGVSQEGVKKSPSDHAKVILNGRGGFF